MSKIKLLLVDNSSLFKDNLSHYIKNESDIEIVGRTSNVSSACDLILKFRPDVMILNAEIPKMDGVSFLKKLLPQYYIATIVVASSDKKEAKYLEAGAVKFLVKPKNRFDAKTAKFTDDLNSFICKTYKKSNPAEEVKKQQTPRQFSVSDKTVEIQNTVKPETRVKTESPRSEAAEMPAQSFSKLRKSDAVIALGASTGGTDALIQVVKEFPEDTPPVLIVQHMPAGFTKMYADRLNKICKMEVKEAENGDRLRRGLIILGAGEYHLRLKKDTKGYYVSSEHGEKVSGHCPSVDVLFTSVAETAGAQSIGAIFTGMGRDGADGLLKMRKAGAFTVGQNKETCVVYGMPMEAYNIGAVEVQAPLGEIARIILNHLI